MISAAANRGLENITYALKQIADESNVSYGDMYAFDCYKSFRAVLTHQAEFSLLAQSLCRIVRDLLGCNFLLAVLDP